MSRENVQTVKRIYRGMNLRDFSTIDRFLDPEIEWHMHGVFPGARGVFHGHDEVREVLTRITATADILVVPQELTPAGDSVLAYVSVRFQGASTASEGEHHLVHLWTLRDGKAIRLRVFTDDKKAVEAANAEQPRTAAAAAGTAVR